MAALPKNETVLVPFPAETNPEEEISPITVNFLVSILVVYVVFPNEISPPATSNL